MYSPSPVNYCASNSKRYSSKSSREIVKRYHCLLNKSEWIKIYLTNMILIEVADPVHKLKGKRYLSTRHKGVWRTENIDPFILNHDTARRGLVSFTS